jgi:hypothetical protein
MVMQDHDSVLTASKTNDDACATAVLQDEMAHAGYRTLLVAQRELSREEYEQWEAAYSAAQVGRPGRSRLDLCITYTDPCAPTSCYLCCWRQQCAVSERAGNAPTAVLLVWGIADMGLSCCCCCVGVHG